MTLPFGARGRAVSVVAALMALALAGYVVASTSFTSDDGVGLASGGSQPSVTHVARDASRGVACMPKPSDCGYPDATNTGVPAGTKLTDTGSVFLDTPGMVFSGKEVHGDIIVRADNVTIENTRVVSDSDYPIRNFYGETKPTGTVIRDVEVNMKGQLEGKAIAFDHYRATRVWFHNGLDCAHAGLNVTITDSFCDLPELPPGSPAHADGFQSDGGRHLTFRHNTIRNPNPQTSAILMSTNTAAIDDVVIDDNLMSGGGYTVYCGTDEGGVATNETYTNNRISRAFFARGGHFGPTTWCDKVDVRSGNRWDGDPLPDRSQKATISSRAAKRFARRSLALEFGRRYTRRSEGLAPKCSGRSKSVVSCKVGWTGPGGRYTGKVRVKWVSANRRRYSLRVRVWSSGCHCSRLIRRSGSL